MTRNRRKQLRLECLEERSVPATFNVTTTLDVVDAGDGKRSLREAITRANDLGGADVIVLSAGVFKLAIAGTGEDDNATGDLDVTDTVTIRGAGRNLSFVDGQQLDRVFEVRGSSPGSINVTLERMTVRNGAAGSNGGGIQVVNANLVVRDAAVTGNRSTNSAGGISSGVGTDVKVVRTIVARNIALTNGGGMAITNTVTLRDSVVRRNVAGADGGGIWADTATLSGCTVAGNDSDSVGGGIWAGSATLSGCTVTGNDANAQGGGIYSSTVTLTDSTVSDNEADSGGGGIVALSTATLKRSTVSGNTTLGVGGGINASTVTLTGSTVSGNRSNTFGGGIAAGNTATLTNSTVSGNTALTNGGGLWAMTATLLNCTIAENFALVGGGLYHEPGGVFSVRNTIVALNLFMPGGSNADVSGIFDSQGHNLIGVNGGIGFANGVDGDIAGTFLNPIDPKLGPLANNGGRTKTHALLAGSPAIDKGDNADQPPTDQRGAGFARKKDGNFDGIARVDIGAFEK
jgi:predicted outer membrane repeat protein